MTPNELYKTKAESETSDLDEICGFYYNHVPEAGEDEGWQYQGTGRVKIKNIKYFSYDERRIWRLATVWFDDIPVMVIQNAGREGDDHSKRFVTDSESLLKMADHLRSLVYVNEEIKTVDCDSDITELTEFYNQSLTGEFKQY